jgi:hypothetical protein
MNKPSMKELEEWVSKEILEVTEDAKESTRIDPNSYGAGYDRGWFNALERVKIFLKGELDT